jgi:hypothetical protein
MAEVKQKPVVVIRTRLGAADDDSSREISFRIPDDVDPFELLELGWAIDGNEAAFTVQYDPEDEHFSGIPYGGISLTAALADTQKSLVAWLRERGYTPKLG